MLSVIVDNVWKMFPYVMLMIEAALQGVSKELKEAAVIDGAGKFEIFRNVTWPAIAPQCYSVLLLMLVWTLNAFTFVYNLTGGGPAHASETIVSYLYTTTFDGMLYGYGMTIAVAEFVFAALISLLSMRLSRRNAD